MLGTDDPFIAYGEKISKRREETGQQTSEDYVKHIQSLLNLSKGDKKKVVSFGKLFCSFMVPSFNKAEDIDETQIFFYTLNDKAGVVSSIPISEFPIDIDAFKERYVEWVAKRGSSSMTTAEFISLVVDSNFKNLNSPAYGFSADLFSKNADSGAIEVKDLQKFEAISLSLNRGRGTFQTPNISFFCEMVYSSPTGEKSLDRLALYEKAATFKKSEKGSKKIFRIHILDSTSTPEASKTFIFRSEFDVTLDSNGMPDRTELESKIKEMSVADAEAKLNAPSRSYMKINATSEGKTVTRNDFIINSREKLRQFLAYTYPTITPGTTGSAVIEASMTSKADPLQKAAILTSIKSGRELGSGPRGVDVGNAPVRVVPSEMNIKTLGCPLLSFGQTFFVDMSTGTSIDNIYNISQVTHSFTPGKFETSIKMSAWDSYAKIETADNTIRKIISELNEVKRAL
jgi:hypothetical protein